MANEAAARANALCPQKGAQKPAPPLAAPTVSISANPATIEQGQCAILAWSTTGATAPRSTRASGAWTSAAPSGMPRQHHAIFDHPRWARAAPGRHRRRSPYLGWHQFQRRRLR